MKCPEQEFVEHYIQGQLTRESLSDFEAHLQTCKNCQTIVAEARENEKLLAEIRTFERTSSEPREPGNREISTVDQAQALLGERYRVIRKIGEGAAALVFQVADTVLDRLVAVKFLRKRDPISQKDCEMGTQNVGSVIFHSHNFINPTMMNRLTSLLILNLFIEL